MKHTAKQPSFETALDPHTQYTNVTTIGNSVYARARAADGAPIYVEQKYCPVYYLPLSEKDKAQATHWGYDGTPLIPHMCDTIHEAREWLESQPLSIYGDIQPEYMVLSDAYGAHDIPYELERLYIWDIDIEVDSEQGFAKPEDPFAEVTAITVIWTHMGKSGTVVYGRGDFEPRGDYKDVLYIKCKTEEELLLRFLDDFRSAGDYPDIVTGYNIQFYDIPYLIKRMQRLFTEEIWIRISPLQRLADRVVILNGRSQVVVDIRGIAILDYLEMYRKFTLVQQESYRLDHIAHVELGKRKLSYEEFGNLRKLYRLDHQKFIEYNITDVRLVEEMNERGKNGAGLIALVVSLAYTAKSNFVDCFKQVRLWDIMIYHKLRAEGKQVPPRREIEKHDQYEGAYVKDPLVGMHHWVCSFDVASMYPHIIREWNLSPETKLKDMVRGLTVDALLERRVDTSEIHKRDVAMASNGVLTERHVEGFLPNMLKTLYDERIRFKNLQKDAKKASETETDPEKKKELKKQIAVYGRQQQVRKVNLNSAYGAIGSNYFRFYDKDLAEAVTVTGQMVIRWVAKDINEYLNGIFKTNEDYIIASDTDSVYVRMERVVELMMRARELTTPQIVEALNQFCDKKIQPIINKSFEDIADYMNVAVPCLKMVRDVIADKAVWTAKKRYIMNVHDSEGVRFKQPELKMMGIEAIKSSTPSVVRKMINDALAILMSGNESDLWTHVSKCEDEFKRQSFEDVAFPRSVNNLGKYERQEKGIPIHVAGVLAFNSALDRTGLSSTYERVRDGEKIKFAYLKQPNPFFTHVMSAPQGCPPEWEIEKWVDYDKQFQKTFIEPVNAILKCAGWTTEKECSLF